MNHITRYFLDQRKWLIALLVLAIVLRVVWPSDMEWKADEQLMHRMAAEASKSKSLPSMGMKSGIGLDNAGFSVWPFVLFYKIGADPLTMVQCVMWSNVLALLLMWWCARQMEADRETMLFGVALVGVNLMMVLFSRKIWAQDLMPIFMALLWFLHLKRKRILPIFLMGVVAAFAGQLHMSGFFYAAGLFLTAIWARQFSVRKILVWISGFLAGLIPAIAWLQSIFNGSNQSGSSWGNIFKLEFLLHGFIDPLGINVQYSLGSDWAIFARYPKAFGLQLYLPVFFAVIIAGLFLYSLFGLVKNRPKWTSWSRMLTRPLFFYFTAFVLIPGLLLTLSGSPIRSHYLIGAAPFLQIALIWLLKRSGKKIVWSVILSQLAITILFLVFVHQSRKISGDYGVPYRHQSEHIIP